MPSPLSQTYTHMWAVRWTFTNKLDGLHDSFYGSWLPRPNCIMKLYRTKRDCQAAIKEHFGYIARRRDLRTEPFCWRMPKAVRVTVTVATA